MTIRVLFLVLLAGALPQDQNLGNSYLGKAPPELVAAKEQWLNVPEPLTLAALRGKVVWIEFGFLKCPPCRKMKPNLIRWHKELAGKGLVVIDISDGTQDKFEDLKKDVADKGETFAVLWDKDAKNCLAYGINAYPNAYLVGVDGKVIWEGLPNPRIEVIEKLMAAELEKVKR